MTTPRLRIWGLRAVLLAVLLGAWAYAAGPGDVSTLLVPDIASVVDTLVTLLLEPSTWAQIGITAMEVAIAFAIAVVLSLIVVFVASRSPLRTRIVEPLLAWGYMIPTVIVFPMFILWFGINSPSKIGFAVFGAFFPMTFTALRGLRSVDERLVSVGRAFGATPNQVEWMVKFPAALPMLLAAIRIGAALALIFVILGEMLAATGGLGFMIRRSTQLLETPESYALIIITLVLVGLYYPLIGRIGRRKGA